MSLQNEYETYLEHYGVKGMRWGVTKQQYKSLNKKQRHQLRSVGYYAQQYQGLTNKKNKGKILRPHQEEIRKNYEKNKEKLEKILNMKISDASAIQSANAEYARQLLIGGLADVLIRGGSRASTYNKLLND